MHVKHSPQPFFSPLTYTNSFPIKKISGVIPNKRRLGFFETTSIGNPTCSTADTSTARPTLVATIKQQSVLCHREGDAIFISSDYASVVECTNHGILSCQVILPAAAGGPQQLFRRLELTEFPNHTPLHSPFVSLQDCIGTLIGEYCRDSRPSVLPLQLTVLKDFEEVNVLQARVKWLKKNIHHYPSGVGSNSNESFAEDIFVALGVSRPEKAEDRSATSDPPAASS